MSNIIDYYMKILCSEKGYSTLFKGGIALVAAAYFSISQYGTSLYDKDFAANKARITFEVSTKTEWRKIDCSKLGSQQADCLVMQYQMKTITSSLKLLNGTFYDFFHFGVALLFLSVVGFLGAPYLSSEPQLEK